MTSRKTIPEHSGLATSAIACETSRREADLLNLQDHSAARPHVCAHARARGRNFEISPRASARVLARLGAEVPAGKPGLAEPRADCGCSCDGWDAVVSRHLALCRPGVRRMALVVLGAAASLILLGCQGPTQLPGGRWFWVRRRWKSWVGFGRCWWGRMGLTWGLKGARSCDGPCGCRIQRDPTHNE